MPLEIPHAWMPEESPEKSYEQSWEPRAQAAAPEDSNSKLDATLNRSLAEHISLPRNDLEAPRTRHRRGTCVAKWDGALN